MEKPLKMLGWAEVEVDPAEWRIKREGTYAHSGGRDNISRETLDREGRWLHWMKVMGR